MECSTIPAKYIASSFALIAFTAALLVGWAIGNTTGTIMFRSLVIMLACWPVGYLVGRIAQHTVQLDIDRYKRTHPISGDSPAAADVSPDQSSAQQESEPSTERSV